MSIAGALIGALLGLGLALLQVKLVRMYAMNKSIEVQERAEDTILQLRFSSFFGLPLIFAVVGFYVGLSYS